MAKTKTNNSILGAPTMTENEAAMDSLDIDLLFEGGDDVVGDGLLFDDNLLDFDDVGLTDGLTDLVGTSSTNNSNTGGGIKTSKGHPTLPSTNRVGSGRGINTNYPGNHSSGSNKKSKTKKRKRSKSNGAINGSSTGTGTNANANASASKDTASNEGDRSALLDTIAGTLPVNTRQKSKRKKKAPAIYNDTDEVIRTKMRKKAAKQTSMSSHAHYDYPSVLVGDINNDVNLPIVAPLITKSKSTSTSTTAVTFPNATAGGKSASMNTGMTGTSTKNSSNRKRGKIQRSLPTQSKRTNSNDVGNSNIHSEMKELVLTRPLTKPSYNSNQPNSNGPMVTTKKLSSSLKKNRKNGFFPFASVPSSCLNGAKSNVMTNLPYLYNVYNNSIPTPQPSTNHRNKAQTPLLHLVGKLVGENRVDEQSIAQCKKIIANTDKKLLITELKQLLTKVNRQTKYMTKSLVQMSNWCNNSFPTIEQSTTATSSSSKKQNKSSSFSSLASNHALASGVSPNIIHHIFNRPYPLPLESTTSTKPSLNISVKVKCNNLKKHDLNRNIRLKALVHPSSVIGTHILLSNYSNILPAKIVRNPATKKRKRPNSAATVSSVLVANNSNAAALVSSSKIIGNKNSNNNNSLSSPTSASLTKTAPTFTTTIAPTPVHKKQSKTKNPREKINFLKKILSQRAAMVEQEMRKIHSPNENNLQERDLERMKLIDLNDDHVYMNTLTMWGVMKNLPYWDELEPSNVSSALSRVWHPEMSDREMFWSEDITPRILVEKNNGEEKEKKEEETMETDTKKESDELLKINKVNPDINVSSYSLFDRLQSMLVEEDGSDDSVSNDSDDDDIINLDGGDGDETCNNDMDTILDVSDLSLDQRAYIHLRAIHLIDQPLLPTSYPTVIEDEIRTGEEVKKNNTDDDDDIKLRVRQMQFELSNQHRSNNTMAASLKQKADIELSQSTRKRKKIEEESSYIGKHSQLVAKARKKKEDANKLRQKENGLEEWVPW